MQQIISIFLHCTIDLNHRSHIICISSFIMANFCYFMGLQNTRISETRGTDLLGIGGARRAPGLIETSINWRPRTDGAEGLEVVTRKDLLLPDGTSVVLGILFGIHQIEEVAALRPFRQPRDLLVHEPRRIHRIPGTIDEIRSKSISIGCKTGMRKRIRRVSLASSAPDL